LVGRGFAALHPYLISIVPTGLNLRDWVISTAAPWVAREDTLEGEPAALEEAVFPNGLDAVVGARGRVAATSPDKGRQRDLIDPYQQNQEVSGQTLDALRNVGPVHGWLFSSFLAFHHSCG